MRVRVRLPCGAGRERRFGAGEPVRRLFDWVDSLEECSFLSYRLVSASSVPAREFGPADWDATLEEAGLAPRAALFVRGEDGSAGAGAGGPG